MKAAFLMVWYTIFSIVFFGVVLFWPAGTFDYWQAWVFIAVFTVAIVGQNIYLAMRRPDVLRRRMSAGPKAETRRAQSALPSATDGALAPGMLATATPRLVAASTSTVLTPAPNLCISRRHFARARSASESGRNTCQTTSASATSR